MRYASAGCVLLLVGASYFWGFSSGKDAELVKWQQAQILAKENSDNLLAEKERKLKKLQQSLLRQVASLEAERVPLAKEIDRYVVNDKANDGSRCVMYSGGLQFVARYHRVSFDTGD